MSVGQNIKIKRKEKNITTTQLAKMIGVDQSTIVRYENGGVRRVSDEQLQKICDALDCSVIELTGAESEISSLKKKKISSKMFSQEEQDLILKYRQLPASAQKIIKEICELQISINQ
ncbi:MAG: helix-turn-helix transcriptional regulator [Solobacterium sp.]|nr:helix-turn-helix transcriptional regulator [Solobacterium sp.]MBR3346501.1 helix-turn-helix transcriptional regulator [Solobacterium sp.]